MKKETKIFWSLEFSIVVWILIFAFYLTNYFVNWFYILGFVFIFFTYFLVFVFEKKKDKGDVP